MKLGTTIKSGWLALVLGGVLLTAFVREPPPSRTPEKKAATTGLIEVDLGGGKRGLLDAGGQPVPLRDYRRLAAGSMVADDLVLSLAEPERIVMLSRFGRTNERKAHLYGQRATFPGPADLEQLKRQRIDLLIINHLGAPAELARMRELGIEVFNLGEMRGLASLIPNIHAVARLLGDPTRGERLARELTRRMDAVSADIPANRRKRAVYVSAYGGQLFGGGRRTSYHDVLSAAGLIDAAAERFADYPHYDAEHLVLMDPEILVTQTTSVAQLCRITGIARLRACADEGRGVVGIDDTLLIDPGLGMLNASEALRDAVYGPPR